MTDLIQIPCPSCNALNRVPMSRLSEQPKCGKCKQPLFLSRPVELSGDNFRSQVLRGDLPVLIDFWAPWCGPCKTMGPAFSQAAVSLEPHIKLAKLNTEAEPDLAANYSIRSIPTMILFHHGREVARQAGAMGTSDIVRWVRSHPLV